MSGSDHTRLQSPDSEHAVIGALLVRPDAADSLGGLKPEHFFSEANRMIFAEILRMVSAGVPVNAVTVAEELDIAGNGERTGGLAYIGEIVANTPGASGLTHHCRVVMDRALERSLMAASDTIIEVVSAPGPTRDKLMAAQSAVMAITESSAPKMPKRIGDVLHGLVELLDLRMNGTVSGVSTGIDEIDRLLNGGLKPGNLVIVAGRPAMGKTTLAVQMALHAAMDDVPALVLSMEMSELELADRLVANAGNVDLDRVIAGDLRGENGERMMAGMGRLSQIPLVIDDQGGLSLFDVAAKARSVKRKHGLGLLVIDYLQLMRGDGSNRNAEIECITRGLKALAKELSIPIICLSQLSRKCEERPNKRPMPSDLRDSGAVEQDADVIAFVYRDEIYNPDTPDKGTAEIIVGKNRQGKTGMARLAFLGERCKFGSLSPDWTPAYAPKQKPAEKGGWS